MQKEIILEIMFHDNSRYFRYYLQRLSDLIVQSKIEWNTLQQDRGCTVCCWPPSPDWYAAAQLLR